MLNSPRLFYRKLDANDATKEYIDWLNNPSINKYLELRHCLHTYESVCEFIHDSNVDEQILLYGIFLSKNNRHIGNLKIGPIDPVHRCADFGILIGDELSWGNGYATEAISFFTYYCFSQLNLNTLTAGCYEQNIGSLRAFEKASWTNYCFLKEYRVDCKGELTGEYLLKATRSNYATFTGNKGCTLIGGGELQALTAKYLVSKGHEVLIVVAPRHSDGSECIRLTEMGCNVYQCEDVNTDIELHSLMEEYNQFSLCFGPAWIFSEEVISIYKSLMFNINAIPLPEYLGGAHYTWQIMNGDRQAGVYIQQITSCIDRGPIVMDKTFSISPTALTPEDYAEDISRQAQSLVQDFVMKACAFPRYIGPISEIDWKDSLYFPRLNTKINGWIDWSWNVSDIHSFCCAFDTPYSGASTYLSGNEVSIRSHSFSTERKFHPYCNGLILRRLDSNIYLVSANGGLLSIEFLSKQHKECKLVGKRLITPHQKLDKSLSSVSYSPFGLHENNE